MAAAGTLVSSNRQTLHLDGPKVYTITLTSDGAGAVTERTFTVPDCRPRMLYVVPASGATQPDDNFALTVLDGFGLDILAGQGATVDNASVTKYQFTERDFILAGTLAPTVASAGAANVITLYLVVD